MHDLDDKSIGLLFVDFFLNSKSILLAFGFACLYV